MGPKERYYLTGSEVPLTPPPMPPPISKQRRHRPIGKRRMDKEMYETPDQANPSQGQQRVRGCRGATRGPQCGKQGPEQLTAAEDGRGAYYLLPPPGAPSKTSLITKSGSASRSWGQRPSATLTYKFLRAASHVPKLKCAPGHRKVCTRRDAPLAVGLHQRLNHYPTEPQVRCLRTWR